MATDTSLRLVLPSELRLIDVVHCACEKMAEVAGFDPDDALNIGLAVREAVINAMMHGNNSDPDLDVDIVLKVDKDVIEARVTDHGDGFDPDQTPDPTAEGNLLRTSGRGLLLIRAFVDEVDFEQPTGGGTAIIMRKHRSRAAESGGN